MSRLTRILAVAAGSLALFAVFAVAGWAATDWLASSDDAAAEFETVAFEVYPLVPAQENPGDRLSQLGFEQDLTYQALNGEASGDGNDESLLIGGSLGAAQAGGQIVQMVDPSLTQVVHVTSPTTGDGTPPTLLETEPGSSADGDTIEEELPADLFDDVPFLFDHLDLRDIRIADPVGPLLIDICAGMTPGATPPAGCPPGGFGGTIHTLDLEFDPLINAHVFPPSSTRCAPSDDTTWRLLVSISAPGTLHLEMWRGSPDSDPPLDAFTGAFDVPTDVADSITAELDAGPSFVRGFFCIEVPAMPGEVVVEHYVVSSYPPHGGARGPSFRSSFEFRSGRPPSGMTAFGTDVLYVRVFRAANEMVWVKAVEVEPGTPTHEVCNTGGRDLRSTRGPTPHGSSPDADVLSELAESIPITVDEAWPYESRFDTLDVYRLQLVAGTQYAVCTYVVDTAPFGNVVFSEAAFVATPTARRMRVVIAGVGANDWTPEAESRVTFIVLPQVSGCQAGWFAHPGRNTHAQLNEVLCGTADEGGPVSSVVDAGGFVVQILTDASSEFDRISSDAWIPVDRDDVVCGTACVGEVERVVRLPVNGFAYTESGRQRARIGYVDLVVTFIPPPSGGFTEWNLGPSDVFDDTNPTLPENPRWWFRHDATTLEIDEVSGTPSATARGRLFADRPVSITARLDSAVPTCGSAGDTVAEYSSAGLLMAHNVEFSGLCIDLSYPLTIEIVDEAGNRQVRSTIFQTAVSQRITLYAELELETLPPRNPRERDTHGWYQTFSLLTVPRYGMSGRAQRAVPPSFGTDIHPRDWIALAGHSTSLICDVDVPGTIPPFHREWVIRDLPARSFGWDVSTEVHRGEFFTRTTTPPCEPNRNNPRAPLNRTWLETVRFSAAGLTLEELLRGVDITISTPHGNPTLRVWAEFSGR